MNRLTIGEITKAVKGTPINVNENLSIEGVSTDTRRIGSGDLFVALVGERFDGNEFAAAALNAGAAAAIVSRVTDEKIPQILVKDTGEALRLLAKYYKEKFNIPVIGVTGSTGKTSTKEMIASVLGQRFKVHKTQQNFNNEIGLPMTLFDLTEEHDISVLEMGMNSFGEIQRLVEVAKPHVGVITNIGTAHIENLGSREGIFRAKMEITHCFTKDSVLIVNGDDDFLGNIEEKNFRVVKVSLRGKGDYNAVNIKNMGEEGIEFSCMYGGSLENFRTSLPGMHNVYNGLIAIALGEMYGLDAFEVKNGIREFSPGKLRMEIITLPDIKIINDCYNANVDSMKAAIDVLSEYKTGKRIAVLGDMYELGDFSEEAHREVGRYLKDKSDMFIAVGQDSKYIYNEAIEFQRGFYYSSKEEACECLKACLDKGDVVLIKASRGMEMEEITKFLTHDRKRGF